MQAYGPPVSAAHLAKVVCHCAMCRMDFSSTNSFYIGFTNRGDSPFRADFRVRWATPNEALLCPRVCQSSVQLFWCCHPP